MTPTATYRLQLHRGSPLAAAREVVPYLARLGVSHVYVSPVLQARTGSTHGYDVVDPTALNPELGSEDDLAALAGALRAADMRLVVDLVPNHMAASAENPFWDDVLAHGTSSPFATWFDVDWGPAGGAPLVLPVLGDHLPRVLARGELRLVWDDARGVRVRYFEHGFPLDPATVPLVLGGDGPPAIAPAIARLAELPSRRRRDPDRRARAAAALDEIAAAAAHGSEARRHIDAAIARYGEGPESTARLGELLAKQAYRLAHWRAAIGEINYRRFFNVSDLVGVRVEDPAVFAPTHARILEWVGRGWIDGLRVDHVDGLWDPRAYLERLRAALDSAAPASRVPIWVEKILTGDEALRPEWPVTGTTGYEFLNRLEDALLDPAGLAAIERWYRESIHRRAMRFDAVARAGKRRLLDTWLLPDARRLGRRLLALVAGAPRATGLGARELTAAIVEVVVCFPVYRTYVDDRADTPSAADRARIDAALATVRSGAVCSAAALDVLADVLLAPGADPACRRFMQRFQQLTAPAMAKGVEDTALYRWVPLASRCEVGGDPGVPVEGAVARLHAGNAERAARWPASLLCTATHDTKRSGDVRARLDVLAEIPARWQARVRAWRRMNRGHRVRRGARLVPDANTEYLLYQTLVGVWSDDPNLAERVRGYMRKAVREAKVHTSWLDPDVEFERALDTFAEGVLGVPGSPFMADVTAFVAGIAAPAMWTALARTLVHLTAPGVPDVYQGDELWNLSLTDPDNRRPVDFAHRRALLDDLDGDPARLVRGAADGRVKLHVVRTALRLRRALPAVFAGGYEPLTAAGTRSAHVIAFARRAGSATAVTIVPRLVFGLTGGTSPPLGHETWHDTAVVPPPEIRLARLTNVLTGTSVAGETLALGEVLRDLPVALLVTAPDGVADVETTAAPRRMDGSP